MRNPAIKVEIVIGQNPSEVKSAAEGIWKILLGSKVQFHIDELALLGQLLAGCGCTDAWGNPD
jgi:hypothetical protein